MHLRRSRHRASFIVSEVYPALRPAEQTVATVRSFFLAMMCFPEAQKKAQEEIDRVIGSDRLPSVADRERLPYVRALCWEVLRWRPIAPLGKSES